MFLPHIFVAMLKDFTTKYPFKNMIKYTRRWLVELWIKGWRWDVSLVVTEAKTTFKQRTRNYCRIKMAIFGEASRASIAGFILTIVSFLFQLIGFATPFWIYASVADKKSYQGLWQGCASEAGTTICGTLSCGMYRNYNKSQI